MWQVFRALDGSVRFWMVLACDHIVIVDTGMTCELIFGDICLDLDTGIMGNGPFYTDF